MRQNQRRFGEKAGKKEGRANKHSQQGEGAERPSRPRDEGDLLTLLEEHPRGLYLILDCIQDPHNLGAILRTAEAAGVVAVIAPKDKSVGITETVRRISVGAADQVAFFAVTNLSRTMKNMQEAGLWIIGTSDRAEKSLYEVTLTGGLALVIGSEEKGMRRLTEEGCDHLVSLPMKGKTECLNASVATGVCLYEAVRQREGA